MFIRIDLMLSCESVLTAIIHLQRIGQPFTVADIADRARCSERTVYRALKRLEQDGRLEIRSGTGRLPSHYEIKEMSYAAGFAGI